jgi:hypothetical protein
MGYLPNRNQTTNHVGQVHIVLADPTSETGFRSYWIYVDDLLSACEKSVNKGQPNGYVGTDANNKINPIHLPAIAITNTYIVASQSAMLALSVTVGSVAVRTDESKSYILKEEPSSTLANWIELQGVSGVASFNGRTNSVTPQSGDYTADQITETLTRVFVTPTLLQKLIDITGIDATAFHSDGTGEINALTDISTISDASVFLAEKTSGFGKVKVAWSLIKSTLKTYFDTIYALANHNHSGVYEPLKGADDNYVTDIEKVNIGNLAGVNTGNQYADQITITGSGSLADPFVAVGGGGGGSGDMLLNSVQNVTAEKIFNDTKLSIKGTGTNKTIFATDETGDGAGHTSTFPAKTGTVAHLDDITGGSPTELDLGSAIPVLGTIRDDSFPGTSLNAIWSQIGTPNITINNGITVNAGSSDWTKGLQFEKFMPYEKFKIEISFVANDKNAASAIGIRTKNLLTFYGVDGFIKFNLQTGQLSAGYDTNANSWIGQSLVFSIGDSLKFTVERIFNTYEITATNITSGLIAKLVIAANLRGTGGKHQISFLGGVQVISNIKISSDVKTNANCLFIGDSITEVSYLELERRYSNLIFNNNYNKFEVCASGAILAYTVAPYIGEISALTPSYAVVMLGYNDSAQQFGTLTTSLNTIVDSLQAAGVEVILCGIAPNQYVVSWNAEVSSVATAKGCKFIDVNTILKGSSATVYNDAYYYDSVHPNDNGQLAIANNIIMNCPELFQDVWSDTSIMKNTSLPAGNETDEIVSVNYKGEFRRTGLRRFFDYAYIKSVLYPKIAQTASIWLSGAVKSSTALEVVTSQGLRIGFNNGVDDTAGSNIDITNSGVGGVGYPQAYNNITGLRNINIRPTSTKSAVGTISISGNDNYIMGLGCTSLSGSNNIHIGTNANISSGSNNKLFGVSAGYGITTGSNNIHISMNDGYNNGSFASVSDCFAIGSSTMWSGNPLVSGDFIFATGYALSTPKFWFGGKSSGSDVYMNITGVGGNNAAGVIGYYRGSMGTGTGTPGKLIFQTSVKTTSGTGWQTTFSNRLSIEELKVLISNVPLFLDTIKSGATQGGASAAANEIWKTSGHATLPDNVLMIGV